MTLKLQTLLGPDDPAPVEVVNANSHAGIVLLCEHAGRAIPKALGDLGVSEEVITSHRGWDIGAENLAREVADMLGAPLVLQRYSRLVIDCNRPPDGAEAIPEVSDHAKVPGNHTLTKGQRAMRIDEIFAPMDAELNRLFAHKPRSAAFSIHSFTPRLNGIDRPWHAGFLSRARADTARILMSDIARSRPDLTLAINEPYRIEAQGDWFIPAHAETRGLAHSLIEIRNDLIGDADGIRLWAGLLAQAITAATREMT